MKSDNTNTDAGLYEAVFKRKSFHLFHGLGKDSIARSELDAIAQAWRGFEPLVPEIRTAVRIVPASKVNFKRDAEYCILIYSEKKENYLMNAGYIGEQLDLWLVSHNIGSLWFGIGRPDQPSFDGLDFVIMIAIHKVTDETKFRKDMFKAKRKPLEETWVGDGLAGADDLGIGDGLGACEGYGVAEIARFAPSACNTQPWYVENKDGVLTVFRYRKPGKRGIMPASSVSYYNRIDMGIYLCILEICLLKNGIAFDRELFTDDGGDEEFTRISVYRLK